MEGVVPFFPMFASSQSKWSQEEGDAQEKGTLQYPRLDIYLAVLDSDCKPILNLNVVLIIIHDLSLSFSRSQDKNHKEECEEQASMAQVEEQVYETAAT